MKTGRRGFFGTIAAAFAGAGVAAAAKTGSLKAGSLKGLAAKVAPLKPSFSAYDLKGLQVGPPYIGAIDGRIVVPDRDKAIAEAVVRALQSGTAPGLREALRNL